MCSTQDTQLLSKRIFSTLGIWDESQDAKSASTRKNSQEVQLNDLAETLVKKKKILDTKVPGLFEHLSKLNQEDNSAEATSVGSEVEHEENKSSIHIPVPRKKSGQHDSSQDLSKGVKVVALGVSNMEKVEPKYSITPQEEEQQQKILQFIMQNSLMLNNAMIQHEHTKRLALECVNKVKLLKSGAVDDNVNRLEQIEKIKEGKQNAIPYNSNPTAEILFNHLFASEKAYKYELVLDCELPQPIFRERNISIKVKLVDTLNGKVSQHNNKITLNLFLQTWEVPSTHIQRNKAGNKAIMGETEVELKDGEALFERIQINEVTSKFIHGYVAMIIVPTKPLNYGTSFVDHSSQSNYISFEEIKPLIIEKVVVKSKKKNTNKKSDK